MSSIRDALRVQAIEQRLEELHALVNCLAERSAEISAKLDALEAQRQDRLAMVRRLEPSNSSRKSY